MENERIYFYSRDAKSRSVALSNSGANEQLYTCGSSESSWKVRRSVFSITWDIPSRLDSFAPRQGWLIGAGVDPSPVHLHRPKGEINLARGAWLLLPSDPDSEQSLHLWLDGLAALAPDLRALIVQSLWDNRVEPATPMSLAGQASQNSGPKSRKILWVSIVFSLLISILCWGTVWFHSMSMSPAREALADLHSSLPQTDRWRPFGSQPAENLVARLASLEDQPASPIELQATLSWVYCNHQYAAWCSVNESEVAGRVFRQWREWLKKSVDEPRRD